MGRAPCCDKANVKKGPWSPEEDAKLKEFVEKFGTGGNWIALPQKAGLKRCGKSCRLRWLNYLRPNIKHGEFSEEEDRTICRLYASIGSRWSIIAAQLPGRTDNDIKNYWNTKLKKKLMGMIPIQQRTFPHPFPGTLQTEPQPQSGQSQLYTDHNTFYFPSAVSLTPVDSLSPPQNFAHCNSENFSLSTSQCSYYHQSQDGLVDLQYYPAGDHINNMLIFGGNEASCSSSDGSCCQISHGKEFHQVKQEEMKCLQDFVSDGFDESLMLMLSYGKIHGDHYLDPFLSRRPNGGLENSQVQCDLEEVSQLISTGNCSNNSVRFT